MDLAVRKQVMKGGGTRKLSRRSGVLGYGKYIVEAFGGNRRGSRTRLWLPWRGDRQFYRRTQRAVKSEPSLFYNILITHLC